MRWFKAVAASAFQNFRKWKYDCRIWVAALLLLVFIHTYTRGLSDFCAHFSVKSSPWLFPFIYMQYYTKILFFLPLILIFSNAPFMDSNQMYILARAGRTRWCLGQICYMILASAVYFIFIIFATILLNINRVEYSNEWGKVLNTLANTDASAAFEIGFVPDRNVIQLFTPMQAMWFTFLHSWLSAIIIGLVIFLFNIKISGSGTFAAGFILVFSAIASKNIILTKYSPVTWSTLNYIQLKRNDGLPSYQYVSVLYFAVIIVLIGCLLFMSRRINIDSVNRK